MSKNQKEQKSVKTEIVKRKDYKELINFVKENRLIENKEKLKENYETKFNLKFNNIERLIKRSLRVESLNNLESNLKELNFKLNEYKEISYKIVSLSKNKKSNFILVEKKQ